LRVITHRLPDFDALASIFLTVRLLETGRVDPGMETIAAYTRMVDSASLPGEVDLAATLIPSFGPCSPEREGTKPLLTGSESPKD
jgi:hypothetical protein